MKVFPLFILPTLARSLNEPKFCINCIYFKNDLWNRNVFAKCRLFTTEVDNKYYLIDGRVTEEVIDYHYCTTARKSESMCGERGQKYIAKQKAKWF